MISVSFCQGCAAQGLPLTKVKRNTFFLSGVRSTPATRRVWGMGQSPIFFCLHLLFVSIWGALRHPPILTNLVDIINKCLLFIFFIKTLDNFFFCIILWLSNKRGA